MLPASSITQLPAISPSGPAPSCCRHFGFQQSRLWTEEGIGFVVRRCVVDFLAPARLDDLLLVASRITEMRGASIDLRAERDARRLGLVRLQVKLVCIEPRRPAGGCRRPFAAPRELRASNNWTEDGNQWVEAAWRSPAPPGMACHPGRCS